MSNILLRLWRWLTAGLPQRRVGAGAAPEAWSEAWLADLAARGEVPRCCPICDWPWSGPRGDPFDPEPDGQKWMVCGHEECGYMMAWPPRRRRLFKPSPKRRPLEAPPSWYTAPEKPRRKPGYPGIG
jgi:hypothetical protein